MEVIGGIKAENAFIKSEDPNENEANIVEITAEDIQGEIKQEREENELIRLEDKGNFDEITIQDIHNAKDGNNQEYKTKGEDQNKTVLTTTIGPEKLILNYQHYNLNDELKKHQHPQKKCTNSNNKNQSKVTKQLLGRGNNDASVKTWKKSKIPLTQNNNNWSVLQNEYTLESKGVKDNIYHCSHCQTTATSKKYIIKHIKHSHRDRAIFENKEEKLNEMLNNTRSRYVAWYEYTLENEKEYRCSHCQALIEGQKEVETHVIKEHRKANQWKQCPHCPYKTNFELSTHILCMHTDVKDIHYYSCDKCQYKAKMKNHLRRHILAMHMDLSEIPDRMYKCNECPKIFKRKYVLREHLMGIHGSKDIRRKKKCIQCSFECKGRDTMKYHVETRHTKIEDLETLKCSQCAFKTKFRSRLHAHNLHHKRILQCHICGYHCTIKDQMGLHIIGHKKEKNEEDLKFRCDKCDYKTYRPYSLQVHKLNHLKPEEIQYFYCYHCNFKAKRKDNLKSHILRHFKKSEDQLACYICDFKTQKSHILVRHINGHSKEASKVKKRCNLKVTSCTDNPLKKIKLDTHCKERETAIRLEPVSKKKASIDKKKTAL